jgi:hypothetical protein
MRRKGKRGAGKRAGIEWFALLLFTLRRIYCKIGTTDFRKQVVYDLWH